MNWIRGLGSSIWIGILGFLAAMAIMAAKRQKGLADKWADTAVDIELGKVTEGTTTAKAASTQAKLHDAKAAEIKKKAEARIGQMGGADREVSEILDKWRQ